MIHTPVFKKEVLEFLDPKPNENFIDCTISGAGHALEILEKIKPNGKILGIDLDPEIIKNLELQVTNLELQERLILVNDSYANLKKIVANLRLVSHREKKYNFFPVNGILADLGMSSWHLEESGRGFSFQRDEILDMRYNPQVNNLTAAKILNKWPGTEIEKILKEYGEEKFSKKIVRKIIEEREKKPIRTTFQLVEIIKKAIPTGYQKRRIHFATRVFQGLRIAVNNELNNLEIFLPQCLEILSSGGRIIVISFHSLEDRIVKKFFKEKNQYLKILTKKSIKPTEQEIKINPRSRSAKLRVAIKK